MDDHYYRQLVETSPDGIAIHCRGSIVFVNQAGAAILGATSPAELLDKPISERVHPDYREIAQLREDQVVAGQSVPLSEERWLRLDGEAVEVEVARYPFEYQHQPAVQLVIHNITQRKQTEAEMIQRNRELTILQSTGEAITSSLDLRFVLDTVVHEIAKLFEVESCAIYEWNEDKGLISMAAQYGPEGWWDSGSAPREQILADYPQTRWVLDEQIPYQMTVRQANVDPAELAYVQAQGIKTRLILPMVFQQLVMGLVALEDTRHERTFTYKEIALAKLLANQAAGAIENARLFEQARQEISDRKRAEAALEEERALLAERVSERTAELSKANAELARAARLKDEFLANMSHELRTPLNGILGSSEILLTGVFGEVNEKQVRYLKNVEESGRHLLSLINDILDLAKSEAGRLELEVQRISVRDVCEASLRLTKQLAHKKKLKVSQQFDKNVDALMADERRLKQVLVNLLSNAIKFTPEGGQVGLDVAGNVAKEVVYFTVWDTGVGISEEDMKWLFQPFVQLDSKLTRQYEGTGLGLSLVSRMAELHGGGVSVESKLGEGSRFTVLLPWDSTADTETGNEPDENITVAATMLSNRAQEKSLILLVDDNEDNINTFTDYLQIFGFRIIVARNGQEAVQRTLEENPDLILMDIQMPGMDGLEATRLIRRTPDVAHVPIIALTALAMPGDKEKCLKAGANEYLNKPVSLKELAQTIEMHLGNSKENNQAKLDSVNEQKGYN